MPTLHRTTATALVLLLITPIATAYTSDIQRVAQEPGSQDMELDTLKEAVNGIDAPGFLNTLVGDQRIQLHLNLTLPDNAPDSVDDQQTLSVTTTGIHVESITTSSIDNPTIEIWAEQEAVEDIITADNTVETLQQHIKDESIDYTVHGLLNKLRFGTAKLLFTLFT